MHTYIQAIMGQMMKCLIVVLIFLLAVEFQELKATDVFYVLSDNSVNVSCLSQPCHSHTLGQYLLINNGTLPQVTNVEYHFLPGEHQVPANMVLTNLSNFSIIGDISEPSSPAVLVGCDHFYVLKINVSHNVTIRNVKFINVATIHNCNLSHLLLVCIYLGVTLV